MARVLVTDAEDRAALAAIRGLAAAGHDVSVAACETPAAGQWSRHCRERHLVPDPRADVEGFVTALEAIVAGGGLDLLLPGRDASLLAVSSRRDRLEPHVGLSLPPHEAVLRALDKWELQRCAAEAALPGPQSVLCEDLGSAQDAAAQLGFPVVLKRRQVAAEEGGGVRHRGSRAIGSPDALRGEVALYGFPCIVQRCVSGPVCSIGGVVTPGGLAAIAFSRYSRVFPPDGGAVSFSQTASIPPGLEEKTAKLVAALGWAGMFELELLETEGGYAAIDFNPRPYGSMALAIAAGAPLPAIWANAALGRPPGGETVRARPGVVYRWEDADLRHALWQLRRRRPRAAAAALRPRRRVVHSFFRLRDPLPLLARLLQMLRHRL